MLDRPNSPLDCREITRAALKHWATIQHMIFDFHGRPLGEVARHPDYVRQDPGRPRRHGAPRVTELRMSFAYPNEGQWHCLSNGTSGDDPIDLVAFLGECDRRTAAEWLRSVCNRMVEVA
jgi:hypothetical protein